jgi:small-conductance mechanosensitive channel
MNELLDQLQGRWPQALGLAIGFPLILVALSELVLVLDRSGHPVTDTVRRVRTWVLPLIAISLFFHWVVLLPSTSLLLRLAETLCWAAVIVSAISVVNNLIFETARQGTWQSKVPRLLRDLLRLVFVAIGLAIVYSVVWGKEIGGAIATLGVTSIVVGLALQEPLGNLFSGLVLLMERPFEVGEMIEVGHFAGQVKEVNWRSAHIESAGGAIQVVPNSTLNKETIVNYSRPRPSRRETIDVRFSYQDPPYKVRQALEELLRQVDGILETPKAQVATVGYEDFGVLYRLIYNTGEQDRVTIKNELYTRLWYMAKRHGFTMPYPVHVQVQHQSTLPFEKEEPEAAEMLSRFPGLPEIASEDRGQTRTMTFGAGERLFDQGDELEGVYIVVSGSVSLQVIQDGEENEIARIRAGEFCGETGMLGRQTSDLRAVALEDTVVALIAPDVVRHLFEASPRLARETGQSLEVHRKAMHSARSANQRG